LSGNGAKALLKVADQSALCQLWVRCTRVTCLWVSSGRYMAYILLYFRCSSAVRESLRNNDNTVVSIFVNPTQFAPSEDLSTYPRTIKHDLDLLSKESPQGALVVFLPSVKEMYPNGIIQDKKKPNGTFVEVKGYDQEMEGGKRPTTFRGVATVVLKLFNIIQVRFKAHFKEATNLV
jgi:pantoate--beta-alanine ligase